MRRVQVFKHDWSDRENGKARKVENGSAVFHEWGTDSTELSCGEYSNQSVAIIERDNGTVETVIPEFIKFVDKNFDCESSENPFCENCKEKDCLCSLDGTCAMIRRYLKKTEIHSIG